MKPEQFIRKYGVEKAREVVEGAPDHAEVYADITETYFKSPSCIYDKNLSVWEDMDRGMDLDLYEEQIWLEDLKCLVESVDLIGAYGSGRLSDYLFHIPNGGSRNILEAAKFKKLGVKAGVPDLQLIVPNGEVHGLWIELKSKKGKLQPSQRLMIQRLEEQGYMCKVCFGADEAISEIKKYLMLEAA